MSQKIIKIILLTLLTVGIVALGLIISRNKNREVAMQLITNIENPFGLPPEDISLGRPSYQDNNQSSQDDVSQNNQNQSNANINFEVREDLPILRRITNQPVAGMVFLNEEREKKIPEEASANLVEMYDFSGYPTIRFGDDRKEVADVKTVLNRQSPSPSLSIDNAFDTDMKNAVILFQTRNNLTPDGVVARTTYQKLNDFQGVKPSTQKGPEKEVVEVVRYIERASGFIFQTATKINENPKMISNVNIPRVYEAYFSDTGNSAILRQLKGFSVENMLVDLVKPTIPSNLNLLDVNIKPLPNNISFISLLPNRQRAIYLTRGSVAEVFSIDLKNGSTRKIWESRFNDWIPQWLSENIVSMTPRASGSFANNSYILDIRNNSLKNIVSRVNGLTTNVSPDGRRVIYSSYEGGQLKTIIMNIASGQISDFSPTVLPEKCVWTKDSKKVFCGAPSVAISGLYPDDWYKGLRLFSDVLWVYDVEENKSKILLDSARIGTQIDITNPQINDKEDYLIFINKHDLSLYGIDLSRLE